MPEHVGQMARIDYLGCSSLGTVVIDPKPSVSNDPFGRYCLRITGDRQPLTSSFVRAPTLAR
jgi:hypothetical protein